VCCRSPPADGEGLQFSGKSKIEIQPAIFHQESKKSPSAYLLQGALAKLYTGRIKIAFLGARVKDDVPGKVVAGIDTCAEGALSGEGAGIAAGPEPPSADDPTSRRRRLALVLSGSSSDSSPEIAAEATSCACLRDDDCDAASLSLPEESSPSELLEAPAVSTPPSSSGEFCPAGRSSG